MSFHRVGDVFRWFIARVEDINDPLQLGRVRARVLNDQTQELSQQIQTEDLLWAWPISAIQSASLDYRVIKRLEGYDVPDFIGAVGLSPTGIAIGSYVFGFYLDGIEENIPVFFGTYHKLSREEEPSDASSAYDIPAHSDVAKIARGEQSLPKEQANSESSNTSPDVAQIVEPKSAYESVYPYNQTFTTKAGHAVEFDDTVGHERIHIYHKSGSYEEISSDVENEVDGRRVIKTTDSKTEIVIKDNNLLVKGNWNIEIDKNANVHIHGTVNMIVDGDVNATVHGNVNAQVDKNVVANVDGNVTATVGGNLSADVTGTSDIHSDGNMSLSSDGNVDISAGGTFKAESGGTATMKGSLGIVKGSAKTVTVA